MTKTILIVSQHTSNWGAERSTCSIAAYLKSMGHHVILIIPKEGEILKIINNYGLEYRVHYFRGWINGKGTNYLRGFVSTLINLFQLIRLYLKLRKERIRPDLIYTNTLVHGFGILLAKLYHVPHLQHIRENIDVFGMNFNWGYKSTLNFIGRNSQKIICTCKAIKDRYLNDLEEEKLEIVYNGIPIAPYKKPVVNPSFFSMVYVGRLYQDKRPKDIFYLIDDLVQSGVKDIRLDVYGNGLMEDELKIFVKEHGLESHISMKGYQTKIDYSRYYLGFLPSEFEAFARTTLEYMMNGLAVIGTKTGGTKEQILHENTGYLYAPGDLTELKNCVLRLYNDRDNCLLYGVNGYERVVNLFSQDKYVEKLGKIFVDCI